MTYIKKNGVYIILHRSSGKMYIGSSGDIDFRIKAHKRLLKNNRHKNKFLQEAYNHDTDLTILSRDFTTIEEARDAEQWLLDKYYPLRKLFNIATDARFPGKGRAYIPSEYRLRRTSEANKGKIISEKHKDLIREARGIKCVIEGVIYPSIAKVAETFGVSQPTVKDRINSKTARFKEWKFKDQTRPIE